MKIDSVTVTIVPSAQKEVDDGEPVKGLRFSAAAHSWDVVDARLYSRDLRMMAEISEIVKKYNGGL